MFPQASRNSGLCPKPINRHSGGGGGGGDPAQFPVVVRFKLFCPSIVRNSQPSGRNKIVTAPAVRV
jgi:hypothetical protein